MRAPRRPHVSHAPHAEDRVIGPRRIRAIKGGLVVDGIARALIVYFIHDASTGTDGLGQLQEVIVIINGLRAARSGQPPLGPIADTSIDTGTEGRQHAETLSP